MIQEEDIYPKGSKDISPFNHKELVAMCQKNDWLKRFGVAFAEDPMMETDYTYNFRSYQDREQLKRFFTWGNWAIRTGAIHQSLCFIQQDNGGDEWWTLKKFEDGEIIAFESISWGHILEDNKKFSLMPKNELQKYIDSWGWKTVQDKINDPFNNYLDRLLKATKEQCRKCEW